MVEDDGLKLVEAQSSQSRTQMILTSPFFPLSTTSPIMESNPALFCQVLMRISSSIEIILISISSRSYPKL